MLFMHNNCVDVTKNMKEEEPRSAQAEPSLA